MNTRNTTTSTEDCTEPASCSSNPAENSQLQNPQKYLVENQPVTRGDIKKILDILKKDQEDFRKDIRENLHLIRSCQEADQQTFKSPANQKHHKRTTRYISYVADAIQSIDRQDLEKAKLTLGALLENLKSFQEDIKLADSSPAGWALVDRIKENTDSKRSREIRSLEKEILDERKAAYLKRKKRTEDESLDGRSDEKVQKTNSWTSSQGEPARNKNYGP